MQIYGHYLEQLTNYLQLLDSSLYQLGFHCNIHKIINTYLYDLYIILIATVTLHINYKNNILAITASGAGIGWCYIRTILGILLIAHSVYGRRYKYS